MDTSKQPVFGMDEASYWLSDTDKLRYDKERGMTDREKMVPIRMRDYGRPLKSVEHYNFVFFTTICITIGTWVMLLPTAYILNDGMLPSMLSTAFDMLAWLYVIGSAFLGGPLLVLWALRHDVFDSWED